MQKSSPLCLKSELEEFAKGLGAYDLRIADPRGGFEKALSGCRPYDVLADCNSVVVFGIYVGLDYHRSLRLENAQNPVFSVSLLFRDWLQYKMADFVRERGYNSTVPSGYFDRGNLISRMSLKLAAHEAGLGVYGRSGIIITPQHGPRVNFGAVLTDAQLEPDEKLTDFDPCQDCRVCVDLCPVKAIRADVSPPVGYDRGGCVSFVQRLREKTGEKKFLCGFCYRFCPAGKTSRHGFTLSRQKTLLDLPMQERQRLINEASLAQSAHS
jgi:epoxyqueuosine reductase QueG